MTVTGDGRLVEPGDHAMAVTPGQTVGRGDTCSRPWGGVEEAGSFPSSLRVTFRLLSLRQEVWFLSGKRGAGL